MQHKWMGVLSREKHPLQQLHLKRGAGVFRGWAYFREVTVVLSTNIKHVEGLHVAHPEVVHGDSERVHDLSINGLIFKIYQVHLLTDLRVGGWREDGGEEG